MIASARRLALALAFVAASSGPAAAQVTNVFTPQVWGGTTTWLKNAWGNRDAFVNAMIDATIRAARASVETLDGQYRPESHFVPSDAVRSQVIGEVAADLAPGQGAGDTQAMAFARARYDDYAATARADGESPDDVVTACAYFADASLRIDRDVAPTPSQHRAIRGGCVLELAGLQAGLLELRTPAERQRAADELALAAAVPLYELAHAQADRATIRTGVERRFQQIFAAPLASVPLDNIACFGASTPKDLESCREVPNERLAAIAFNTR